MARRKNGDWIIPEGNVSIDHAQLAVLMDIRDELQRLNSLFRCSNFLEVPSVLRQIRANTAKPRKVKP